jgi:hypothetical protein
VVEISALTGGPIQTIRPKVPKLADLMDNAEANVLAFTLL